MILVKGQAWDRQTRALVGILLSSNNYYDPATGEPYCAAILDAAESWSVVTEGLPQSVVSRDTASLGIAVSQAPPAVLTSLFSGHPVELRVIESAATPWSAASPLQKGTWDGESFAGDSLQLGARSALGALLDRDFPLATYTGEGGLEGPPDLNGEYKPRAFGLCRNVTPVLVDPNAHVYQVSSYFIASTVPREAGILVAGGAFTSDLNNGRFTFNFLPALEVTADVTGADDKNDPLVNPVEVLRALLVEVGAAIDEDSFDAASASSEGYVFGTYVTAPVPMRELVALMVRSIILPAGIPVLVEEGGVLAIRAIGTRPLVPVVGMGRGANMDLSSTPGLFRTGMVRVAHSKNWTEMDDASLVGPRDSDPGFAAFASRPFATFELPDADVEQEAPGRAPVDVDTGLDGEAAAEAVAARWMAVLRWPWSSAAVSTLRVPPGLRAGDAVYLETGAETAMLASVAGVSSAPIYRSGTVLLLIPQDPLYLADESGALLVDENGAFLVDDL